MSAAREAPAPPKEGSGKASASGASPKKKAGGKDKLSKADKKEKGAAPGSKDAAPDESARAASEAQPAADPFVQSEAEPPPPDPAVHGPGPAEPTAPAPEIPAHSDVGPAVAALSTRAAATELQHVVDAAEADHNAKAAEGGQEELEPAPATCMGKAKDWARVAKIGLVSILKASAGDVVVPALHRERLTEDGVTHQLLQQYMTWRVGALMASFLFHGVFIGLQSRTMGATVKKKAEILSSFPSDVKLFASALPRHLAYQEIALCAALIVAALCVLGAAVSWRHYKRSRFLVWVAWATGIVVPFVLTLCWPYRLSVDWDGANNHVCQTSISNSLAFDPTVKQVFEGYAAVTPNMSDFRQGVNPDTVKAFCTKYPYDWQAKWYGSPKTEGLFLGFLRLGVTNCLSKGVQMYNGSSCTAQNCTIHPCLLNQSYVDAAQRASGRRLDASNTSGAADLGIGNWSFFPGDECSRIRNASICTSDRWCSWVTDYGPGVCVQNQTLAELQEAECSPIDDPGNCSRSTNCRWSISDSACISPLLIGLYARGAYEQMKSTIKASGDSDFWFPDYESAMSCYKTSLGFCNPLEKVGDGECQLECASPQCVFDALDCCAYLGVDCGSNRTSRDAVMGPLYEKGLAFLQSGGSLDDLLSMFPDVDDDSYQDRLASEYTLNKDDMAGTSWSDMDDKAEAAYGNDGEGVDQALTEQANKLAKTIMKNMTMKSVGDVVDAVSKKVDRLQENLKSKVFLAIKKAFQQITAAQNVRRLSDEPDIGRRLSSEEAIVRQGVQDAIRAETQKFYNKTVPQLQATTSAVVMLDAVGTMSQSSQVATNMYKSSQYLLGILMGLYALKSLFPLAIGVVGGLTKGIVNIHNLLPATVMGNYLEMVVVAANLPLITAFLATLYQVVGVVHIIPGVFLLVFYLAMPAFRVYFYSFIKDYMDRAEVKKADSRMSIIQNLFLVSALAVFIWYVTGLQGVDAMAKDFVRRIRAKQLFVADVIVTKAVQMFATGLMTAVASADLVFTFEGLAGAHFRRMELKAKDYFKAVLAHWSATVLHVTDTPRLPLLTEDEKVAEQAEATKGETVIAVEDGEKHGAEPKLEEPPAEPSCCKDWARVFCIGLKSVIAARASDVVVPEYHRRILEAAGVECKELQQYTIFRLGALIVSVVFSIVLVGLQAKAMNETIRKKAELLSPFPPDVKLFAASFPKHLAWMEWAIFASLVASAVLVIFAVASWRHYKCSRYLVWAAWFIKIVVPFVVLLIWPYRASVNWQGAVESLCQKTVLNSVSANPGMKSIFEAYAQSNPGLADWAQGVTADRAKAFCKKSGMEWQAKWFGSPTTQGALMVFTNSAVNQCLSQGLNLVNGTCTAQNCSLAPCLLLNVSGIFNASTSSAKRRLAATDVGDWTSLPGETCNTLSDAANRYGCGNSSMCQWDNDTASCLQNETLALRQFEECSALSGGDVASCVNHTACRWNLQGGFCEAPLATGLYARLTYAQIQQDVLTKMDPALTQFWFSSFSQAWACYKNTSGACNPLDMVGDGECQLECANPACLYDALDCCLYLGVDCGSNATSRNQVMGQLYAKGAAFLQAGGSVDDLVDMLQSSEDEAFQQAMVASYGLAEGDVQGSQWGAMDPSAAESFADDPEGVDQHMDTIGAQLAKSVGKSLKVKGPADLVTSVATKMSKLESRMVSKIVRSVKKVLDSDSANPTRRLDSQEDQIKAAVFATINTEMDSFEATAVTSLRASATGMMLLNVMQTMTQASVLATNIYKKAEYLLGAYMGLVSLKSLLPMCIGVVGGLTKGIVNVHNLLPQTVIGGFIEITVVVASVPQLAAFLATIFQIVGVVQIIPGVVCLILYLAMPGWRLYFYSFIKNHLDRTQIQKADSRLGMLGNLFLLISAVVIIWYILGMTGINPRDLEFLKAIRIKEMFTGPVIYTKVVTIVSAGLVSAVAASDCIISIEGLAGAHFRKMDRKNKDHLKETLLAWSRTVLRVQAAEGEAEYRPAVTDKE